MRIVLELNTSDLTGRFYVGAFIRLDNGFVRCWDWNKDLSALENHWRNMKEDISFYGTRINRSINQLRTNLRYKIITMKQEGSKTIITVIAVSLLAVGFIAEKRMTKPDKLQAFTDTPQAYRQDPELIEVTPVYAPSKGEDLKRLEEPKVQIVAKAKKAPQKAVKQASTRVQRKITHETFTKVINSEPVTGDRVTRNVALLLNLAEGYYPIPYWDNKQYSVGYGSCASLNDCKRLWSAMGLSEQQGKDLAMSLHKIGFREARKICKKWEGKPGTVSRAEAARLREVEFSKFRVQVEEHFTFLPKYQQEVLTMLTYNTGWAGFYGYKPKGMPKSKLAIALETKDWWHPDVYAAWTQLKAYNKGLYNRRCIERNAFFSEKREDSKLATSKKLAEAMAFSAP
jgi:hypothetical protein